MTENIPKYRTDIFTISQEHVSDIIHLLPDSVANQIAAGEVIQRPASVVKELVENAIDAGAETIKVVVKEGGNTLIQVVDDGKGMSETDARMAFERHATSKIQDAADIFTLHTFGFRGEALASIAAVAQVELRTRREEDTLGTFIEIAGTRIFRQESIQCGKGTNISVKNLFFNVPARRRFLKSPSTEMMHIRNEFYRIVLVHPEVNFLFYDNEIETMQLLATNLKGRIENVFDNISRKKMEQQLLPVDVQTSLLSIKGYIGRPEFSQKSANQYFFVNGRYMRHPYFHKAISTAYSNLIKGDDKPNYFIYFDIDPQKIDINVHPSKTEIKFENENAIWSILLVAVKESLGKFQVSPALDFDNEGMPDIPVLDSKTLVRPPQTSFNPHYNPFETRASKKPIKEWEELYKNSSENKLKNWNKNDEASFENKLSSSHFADILPEIDLGTAKDTDFFQFKNKYIVSSVQSGLMLINQHRAHFRILYDRLMLKIKSKRGVSQQILFPEMLEVAFNDKVIIEKMLEELYWVGFDIELFGDNAYVINGVPSELETGSALPLLKELIDSLKETELSAKEKIQETIVRFISKKAAIKTGQSLSDEEIEKLIMDLFSCSNHQYTPDGRNIVSIFQQEEIDRKFR